MSKKPWVLSKSACAKYMQCPASFEYHYFQKIRPIKTGSALIFGSAIDAGLNAILTKSGDPVDAFVLEMAKLPFGEMAPAVNDWDIELLSAEELKRVELYGQNNGYKGNDFNGMVVTLLERLKAGEDLSENQYKVIDYACRACLFVKATLMFKAYVEQVLPNITKVINVQKKSGPGFLDATVEWKGRGTVILDHKTASKRYPENECEYSLELALYAGDEKINQVAYVVLPKMVQKNRIKTCVACGNRVTTQHKTCNAEIEGERCGGDLDITIDPAVEIQVLHGDVTPRAIEVAQEVQREVKRAVDAKIFPCNFGQCNNQFGKPCIYRDLKWKGSMKGLKRLVK